MTAEHVTGLFELHVFVEPLDPPDDVVERFRAACRSASPPMKALLLELDYVGKGFVGVLQSSRYVEGDVAAARAAIAGDAAHLRAAGFRVIREKIEAMATAAGVPGDAAAAQQSPTDRYFEFHVLIDRASGLTDDDMRTIRTLGEALAAQLGTPVPLSYNALKPGQRFLNLRARGCGLDRAMRPVDELRAALADRGALEVVKVIAEYICFDTNRAVDNGWLEPLP